MEYTEWFDMKHTGKVCEKFLSWTDMNDLETLSFRIDVEVVDVERWEEPEEEANGDGTLSILGGGAPRKMSNSVSKDTRGQRPKTPRKMSNNDTSHFLEISDPAQILLLLTSATQKVGGVPDGAMDGKLEEMAEAKVNGDDMFRINGVLQQKLADEVEEQLDALNMMVDELKEENERMREELDRLRIANADYEEREEREQVMAHQIDLLNAELASVRKQYSDSAAENGKLTKKLYETKMSVQIEREKQCEMEIKEAMKDREQLEQAKAELNKMKYRNTQVGWYMGLWRGVFGLNLFTDSICFKFHEF